MALIDIIFHGETIISQIKEKSCDLQQSIKYLKYDQVAQYVLDFIEDWSDVPEIVWEGFSNHHSDVIRMIANNKRCVSLLTVI